ncbi:MAG: GNAT family N-acetyltransferase [Pseudomonadota bacterium]
MQGERDLDIRFAPVDRSTWPDLERCMERRGGPHYCWCMLWRPMPSKDRGDKAKKKAALMSLVDQGTPVGLLGYVEDEPVAWCSVGPRPSLRRLGDGDLDDERIWSIVCFFVHRQRRGRGLTSRLIEAAVDYAKSNGATIVEAYPVDRDATSYRFMGFVDRFERAGFVDLGQRGTRRHSMRVAIREQPKIPAKGATI